MEQEFNLQRRPRRLGGLCKRVPSPNCGLSRAWDATPSLLERNAEFGKAPAWPPGIPSWPPALGGGDGVCPGEPAAERTAGAALDEPLRAVVTVLEEIQSREPLWSCAADRRCGWRPRGSVEGSRGRLFAIRLPRARTTVSPSFHLGGSGPDGDASPRETLSRLRGWAGWPSRGLRSRAVGAGAPRLPASGGPSTLRRRRETPASARPHPLRGPRPRSSEVGNAPRRGRNRGAAAPPAGAGRLRSRHAVLTLKVELALFPTHASGSPESVLFTRGKSPWRSGPSRPNGRSLWVPAAISLIPWPHYLQVLVCGCPSIDFDNHS
ncbi:uncharacterized protein LOC123614788 [Camelus bactrianus]|uniref:Uncharacterized protein LOC123614788 n=1 Tax=Camelus bactrianus TaxID=9837 RepID=A0AC58PVQ0_CAMBA